jgi:hypothetical protein
MRRGERTLTGATVTGDTVEGEGLMIAQTVHTVSVAHAIHYAVLAVGLVGLLALLAPRFAPVRRTADEHELRVVALAGQISAGTLGQTAHTATGWSGPAGRSRPDAVSGTLLPLALVSSAAAAAVHATIGPEHFREQVVFGIFFALAATAQIAWSCAMVARPGRRLVAMAALGNAGVLALWLITRTAGLPFGLLPRPESIGPWDAACALWELVVVGACLQLLHHLRPSPSRTVPPALRLARWDGWHRAARTWTLASVLVLGLLSLNGIGS